METNEDEVVMYILARKDLNMSPGKLASQVGHGVQLAINEAERYRWSDRLLLHYLDEGNPLDLKNTLFYYLLKWKNNSYAKIVLEVNSYGEMNELAFDIWKAPLVPSICGVEVIDEGRTELNPNECTCIAFPPVPKSVMKPFLGHLRLYK